jgi:hypothetical protein
MIFHFASGLFLCRHAIFFLETLGAAFLTGLAPFFVQHINRSCGGEIDFAKIFFLST